jgi:hypothetical protein
MSGQLLYGVSTIIKIYVKDATINFITNHEVDPDRSA